MSEESEHDEEEDKACSNPTCDCLVHHESDYCCEACSDSDSEDRCHCPHKSCKGRKNRPAPIR